MVWQQTGEIAISGPVHGKVLGARTEPIRLRWMIQRFEDARGHRFRIGDGDKAAEAAAVQNLGWTGRTISADDRATEGQGLIGVLVVMSI